MIRAKCNTRFYACESRPADKSTGLRCAQIIPPNSRQARRDYPEKPRRIRYNDAETDLSLIFLINNFVLPALIIAAIYRRRWEIGVVLPLDQTAPALARILLHKPQRRSRADLEGDLLLSVARNRETRNSAAGQSPLGSADCLELRT